MLPPEFTKYQQHAMGFKDLVRLGSFCIYHIVTSFFILVGKTHCNGSYKTGLTEFFFSYNNKASKDIYVVNIGKVCT